MRVHGILAAAKFYLSLKHPPPPPSEDCPDCMKLQRAS